MLWIEQAHANTKGGNGLMVAGSGHGSAAKGSAIDLEVRWLLSGGLLFFLSLLFFTMCFSLYCLVNK